MNMMGSPTCGYDCEIADLDHIILGCQEISQAATETLQDLNLCIVTFVEFAFMLTVIKALGVLE